MKKNYIIIAVLAIISILAFVCLVVLDGLSNMGNPNGNSAPDYPYFITTRPVIVKKIMVPKGTKLIYEEQFFRKGMQDKIMNEKKLTDIVLPKGKTIDWGGVPVCRFMKFFNSEMKGYSVYADFGHLSDDKKTKFSQMWQHCGGELGVLVKNTDDWTSNRKNIADISDCSVTYQRFFKDDVEQQRFLDTLLSEVKKNVQNQ